MKWFMKRLKEPSTWAASAATVPTITLASSQGNTTVTVLSAIFALLGVLLPEDTAKARQFTR